MELINFDVMIFYVNSWKRIFCAAAPSGCFLRGLVPAGETSGTAMVVVAVIFPVTKIYTSE